VNYQSMGNNCERGKGTGGGSPRIWSERGSDSGSQKGLSLIIGEKAPG